MTARYLVMSLLWVLAACDDGAKPDAGAPSASTPEEGSAPLAQDECAAIADHVDALRVAAYLTPKDGPRGRDALIADCTKDADFNAQFQCMAKAQDVTTAAECNSSHDWIARADKLSAAECERFESQVVAYYTEMLDDEQTRAIKIEQHSGCDPESQDAHGVVQRRCAIDKGYNGAGCSELAEKAKLVN